MGTLERHSSVVIRTLIPAIEKHEEVFGRLPELVAADGEFYSNANMDKAAEMGIKKVAVPGRKGRGMKKKKERKPRWYIDALRSRVGWEGRISVVKRPSGLARSRYKGRSGIKRWVGLGVIADNLVRGNKTKLEPGMCFSDEPMIAIYGEFGVRLEDCIYITDDGAVTFTPQSPSIDQPFG